MRKLAQVLLVVGIVAAIAVGVMATFTTPALAKGRCICPMIYAPVECDKGRVFANQCLADCRNAKNCVPIGIL